MLRSRTSHSLLICAVAQNTIMRPWYARRRQTTHDNAPITHSRPQLSTTIPHC